MGTLLGISVAVIVAAVAGVVVGWLFFPMPAFIAKLLGKTPAA